MTAAVFQQHRLYKILEADRGATTSALDTGSQLTKLAAAAVFSTGPAVVFVIADVDTTIGTEFLPWRTNATPLLTTLSTAAPFSTGTTMIFVVLSIDTGLVAEGVLIGTDTLA
jgi:hypothetical protein